MKERPWFKKTQLLQSEHYWTIWLGLVIIGVAVLAFWSGGLFVKHIAVTPEKWRDFSEVTNDLSTHWGAYFSIFLSFLAVFSLSMWIMGHKLKQ